jgi:hypothetical protein
MEELVRRRLEVQVSGKPEHERQNKQVGSLASPPSKSWCVTSTYVTQAATNLPFISRGQPQKVASVASGDANAWWHVALSTLATNMQSMARINALEWPTYMRCYRLDLEGAWKQSGLDRTIRSAGIVFFFRGISRLAPSSRPCISCNKQPAGVLALAKLQRKQPQSR